MDAFNRMRLAQYHNRRGVRMLKCASGVESCRHREAFVRLAKECFEARDHQMREVRIELCKRKRYAWHVVIGWTVLACVVAHDELTAAIMFEHQCRMHGIPVGNYMLAKIGRSNKPAMISGGAL